MNWCINLWQMQMIFNLFGQSSVYHYSTLDWRVVTGWQIPHILFCLFIFALPTRFRKHLFNGPLLKLGSRICMVHVSEFYFHFQKRRQHVFETTRWRRHPRKTNGEPLQTTKFIIIDLSWRSEHDKKLRKQKDERRLGLSLGRLCLRSVLSFGAALTPALSSGSNTLKSRASARRTALAHLCCLFHQSINWPYHGAPLRWVVTTFQARRM